MATVVAWVDIESHSNVGTPLGVNVSRVVMQCVGDNGRTPGIQYSDDWRNPLIQDNFMLQYISYI